MPGRDASGAISVTGSTPGGSSAGTRRISQIASATPSAPPATASSIARAAAGGRRGRGRAEREMEAEFAAPRGAATTSSPATFVQPISSRQPTPPKRSSNADRESRTRSPASGTTLVLWPLMRSPSSASS